MGLGLEYRIRLASRKAVSPFLAAARSEAKSRGWKISSVPKAAAAVELLPHPKCEPLQLDLSTSLACDGYVKTSFAPERVHIQIVDFLKAMKPRVKSMKVEDECDFWATGDKKLLRGHRSRLADAAAKAGSGAAASSPQITYGAITIKEDRRGRTTVTIKRGTNISAKEIAFMRREGFVVKIDRTR